MSFDSKDLLTKLREFCKSYFSGKATTQQKNELSQQFNKYVPQICGKLCEKLNSEQLDKEPNIASVKGLCYVFGDIHGNLEDVYDYENKFWMNASAEKEATYMFLGDFVDRGIFSVEVSLYLLALKLNEGSRFILVRGNHEVRVVNKGYTFFNECVKKFGQKNGQIVWDQINTCFERLPLAAVIDGLVFCCHGGVPKSFQSMDDITKAPKPLVDPAIECPVAHELLWDDPIESMATYTQLTDRLIRQKRIEFIANKARSTGFYFTALAAKRFLDSNGFSHMIRAHECVDEGYRYTSDERVLTVFSSSNYCGKNNTTACVRVTHKQIQIHLIKTPQPSKTVQDSTQVSPQSSVQSSTQSNT